MNERELLEMALAGYALAREAIEMRITMVRLMLGYFVPGTSRDIETLPIGPGGAEWPVRFVPRERLGRRRSRG